MRAVMIPIVLAVGGLAVGALAQTTRHVATCGDDAWTGLSAACAAPNGPKLTIQAAITASVSGDMVVVADGTYTGSGNRDIDFGGRNITLRSAGGSAACTIDAEDALGHRGFRFHGGETAGARVIGFTIRGGNVSGDGGGILIEGASPIIESCVITQNQAHDEGAGAHCAGGGAVFVDCSFIDNANLHTTDRGGGLFVGAEARVTLHGCSFSGHSVLTDGGAILCESASLQLLACRVEGNSAGGGGGGLYCSAADATVAGCFFDGNGADSGGAIRTSVARLSITRTVFERNHAIQTGGLHVEDTVLHLDACVVRASENSAAADSAIRAEDGFVVLSNCVIAQNEWPVLNIGTPALVRGCTLAHNQPSSNGASGITFSATSTVANSILWANGAQASSGASITYSVVEGGHPGAGNLDEDPLFVNAGAGDFRLRPGSPCIDAGNNNAGFAGATTDLAGSPRFFDDPLTPDTGLGTPPIVDMGAYEFRGAVCYADCNSDGQLTVADFACFQTRFVSGCP